ncbi:MAG: transposase [Terriglobales bacterium]
MAHTYISALLHVVFSTKGRQKTISAQLQPKLWAYLGGIARRNGMTAVQVGGIADHVHVLLILPATMPIAKAVQLLKGGSSKNGFTTRKANRLPGRMDMAHSPSAFLNCKPQSHTFATRRNITANAPSKRSSSPS